MASQLSLQIFEVFRATRRAGLLRDF